MQKLQELATWIKNNAFFAGLAVAAAVIVIIFFPESEQNQRPTQQPTPQPTSTQQPENQPLALPTVFPQPGAVEMADSRNAIILFFQEPIDLATIATDVVPNLTLSASVPPDDPKQIILTPKTPWKADTTYTITINRGVQSRSGVEGNARVLQENITLTYQIEEIEAFNPRGGI